MAQFQHSAIVPAIHPAAVPLTAFYESFENPVPTTYSTPAAPAGPTGKPASSEKFSASFPGPAFQLPPWTVFESLTLKQKVDHAALHFMNFVKHYILCKPGEVDLNNNEYDLKMHSALGGILQEYVVSKRETEYQHNHRKPFLGLASVTEIYQGSNRAKSKRPYAKRSNLAGELVDFLFGGGGHPIGVLVALMFVVNLKESSKAIQNATGLKAQNSNGKQKKKKQVVACMRCKKNNDRPTCGQNDCSSQPLFNFKKEAKAVFCSRHKASGMVNVIRSDRCEHDGCFAQKRFNYPGLKGGVFCRLHKLEGMVDPYKRSCEEKGCEKIPNFNFQGENRALFCALHKAEGMVNVLNSRCEHIGCEKLPSFNFEDEPGRRFCGNHKMTGMVDVTRKNGCKQQGCFKRPYFCSEGEARPSFCQKHKQDGMIDLRKEKKRVIGCSQYDDDACV